MMIGTGRALMSRVESTAEKSPAEGMEIDLSSVVRALWRRKALIIGPTLLAFAAAIFLVGRMTPIYQAESRVLVENGESIYTRSGLAIRNGAGSSEALDQTAVQSQVQLLLSRDLARAVVAQTHLTDVPEFNPPAGPSLLKKVLVVLGLSRDPLGMTPTERAVENFREKLTAYVIAGSRVIDIQFSSADPDLAAKVANAVAEQYLVFTQRAKQSSTREASDWLASQIKDLQAKVSEAEAKVEHYRSESGLFGGGANGGTIAGQQLSDLNADLARARSQQSDAEAKAQTIRAMLNDGKTVDSLDVGNSDLIRRLLEQRVTQQAALARDLRTFLPGHPRIKEEQAQLAALDRQIRLEAVRIARAYENEANVAAARVADLRNTIAAQMKVTGSSNADSVELRALERNAKAQRDLLEEFLTRYREATARESLEATPPDARVISRATVPTRPYFPKPLPIVIIATLAVFFITAAAALMRDYFAPLPEGFAPLPPAPEPKKKRRRISLFRRKESALGPSFSLMGRLATVRAEQELPEPVSEAEDAAVAAEVETEVGDTSRFLTGKPDFDAAGPLLPLSSAASDFSAGMVLVPDAAASGEAEGVAALEVTDMAHLAELADRLAERTPASNTLSILATGVDPMIDPGSVALAFGRALAASGRSTVLVDAIGGEGALNAAAGSAAHGLGDLLSGDASFADVIQPDGAFGTHVIPFGHAALSSTAWLRLGVVLDALCETYDFVIIQAPPPQDGTALRHIARRASAAILVSMDGPASGAVTAGHAQLLNFGIEDVILVRAAAETVRREGRELSA